MELPTLTRFLCLQLDEYGQFCHPFAVELNTFRQTSALLEACGHDTGELDAAILAAERASLELKAARERAVARFKTGGVCFTVESRVDGAECGRLVRLDHPPDQLGRLVVGEEGGAPVVVPPGARQGAGQEAGLEEALGQAVDHRERGDGQLEP